MNVKSQNINLYNNESRGIIIFNFHTRHFSVAKDALAEHTIHALLKDILIVQVNDLALMPYLQGVALPLN